MLRHVLITIACVALVPAAFPAPAPASSERMDRIVREYVDAKQFMGAVLVARGDEVIFARSYGSANLEWDIPNATNTKFRLGSITKQFTAAAILLLEERGKLKVDDPVKKHYPDAPATWDKITLAHLLAHTSGIPNYTSFPDRDTFERVPTTPAELVAKFRDKPLEFVPGTEMRYSNSGYALLGLVIETTSGMSYAKFLDDNIFKPLGMNDSGYDSHASIIAHRADGYAHGPNGLENASFLSMTVPYAAGALYSTVENLHRWNHGLFGGKVLKPASLARMTTPPTGDYAFGIARGNRAGQRVLEHGGGINGFNTKLAYYPEDKVTVVALSNINGPGADNIVDKLGALVHGEAVTLPSEREHVSLPAGTLQDYVGTYELRPGFDFVMTVEEGKLMVSPTGQMKDQLFAESRDHFFSRKVDATIEFVRDASGKVTHFMLHQGAFHGKAPRK